MMEVGRTSEAPRPTMTHRLSWRPPMRRARRRGSWKSWRSGD